MAKEKTESYYKILGTTANIGQGKIKEKYIQAVKEHPPETDPEGFEKVRRAYETLKDPVKRKEYDLYRKYGDKVEKILEQALNALDKSDFQKAEDLFRQAARISPDSWPVTAGLMHMAIINDNFEEADTLFKKALSMTSDTEEIAIIYSVKAKMLAENGYFDEALELLSEGQEQYPDGASLLAVSYASICVDLEWMDKAWEAITVAIPAPEHETPEDMHLFMSWINLMVSADKWSALSKVKSRFRKFLKKLTENEDKEDAISLLMEEYEECYDQGEFRLAELFLDLVKVLVGNNDPEIKEKQNEIKTFSRLQKEIHRLQHDEDVFPLISLQAFEWFYKDIIPPEQLHAMVGTLPYIDELEQEKEAYAAGIMRLNKKYPTVYKYYQEEWDRLFAELTAGFNRQMKRDLRKFK